MPTRPKTHRPATLTQPERRTNAHDRGYDHRWRRARAAYLRAHPLCVQCQAEGRLAAASVVDHIVPHKGDYDRFWDSEGNWQSLCKRCHDMKTAMRDGAFGREVKPKPTR